MATRLDQLAHEVGEALRHPLLGEALCSLPPRPRLKIKKVDRATYYVDRERLRGELSFDYGGEVVPQDAPARAA